MWGPTFDALFFLIILTALSGVVVVDVEGLLKCYDKRPSQSPTAATLSTFSNPSFGKEMERMRCLTFLALSVSLFCPSSCCSLGVFYLYSRHDVMCVDRASAGSLCTFEFWIVLGAVWLIFVFSISAIWVLSIFWVSCNY